MQKGSLLYTVLITALTCKALPQYGSTNQNFHQEGILQNIKENQQQPALSSSQHIQSTHHAPQSTPQQQSQHLSSNNTAPQTQQATQSLGHHNGDNLPPIGGINVGLQCGSPSLECVPYFQCVDGYINTDGAGIIDARGLPESTCSNPDYPDVQAVCCHISDSPNPTENYPPMTNVQTPTPITSRDVCPFGSACLPDVLCQGEVIDETGNIVPFTPGGAYAKCIIGEEFTFPGVCCNNPLPTQPPVTTTASAIVPLVTNLPTISQCGIRQNGITEIPAQRILSNVSYNEAQFGEFPWQAIIFLSNYTFKCGASIIGDRWLLTAAHCVNGFGANDFNIRAGEWQVNTFDEQYPYVDASVAAITVHPDFNARNVHNDIAIIELVEPLSPQYHINSVCLPAPGQTFWGQRCFSTGWGKDSFNGQYQTIMRKVELPLVEHQQCQKLLRKTRLGRYFNLDNSFMCAGGEENEDACKGDGGGPLACQDPNSGDYVLTGITAWGISCGKKDIPGVYADVQTFVPWIEAVIAGTYNVNYIDDHSTNIQPINQTQPNRQSLHTQQNNNQYQNHQTDNQAQLVSNNQVNNDDSYGK